MSDRSSAAAALQSAHLRIARPTDRIDELLTFYTRVLDFVSLDDFQQNHYWDARGRTYEDPDGYRIVIQQAAWSPSCCVTGKATTQLALRAGLGRLHVKPWKPNS